jgi:hypothetical protein
MVSSLEVAENFVPNDAEQEEAIVHHALVGAVNSKANLANSQDGGDEILWGIMLPWIKDHGCAVRQTAAAGHYNRHVRSSKIWQATVR